VFAQENDKNAV
jgi:hypothetical protein